MLEVSEFSSFAPSAPAYLSYPEVPQHQHQGLPYFQRKESEMQAPQAPPPPQPRTHGPIAEPNQNQYAPIEVASFIRFRDSHTASLYQLEYGAQQLRFKFMQDTDELLRRGTITTQDIVNLQNGFGGFANQNLPPLPQRPIEQGATAPPAKPEKKPKRPHDKNAPTKAMTPFFLYMQTERPKIQKELGPNYKPKEVEAIGQQRWKEISDEEKQAVKYQYFCNRAGYYKQNELYKAGLQYPEYTQAEKERFYAEELEKEHASKIRGPGATAIPAPKAVAARAKSHEPATETETTSDDDDEDSESEDDETPAPAKKDPTPPPAKKRKAVAVDVVSTPATATKYPPKFKSLSQPEVTEETPVKGKKKKDKKEAAAMAPPPAVTQSSPVPVAVPSSQVGGEKKRKRKLRKSEAVGDDE